MYTCANNFQFSAFRFTSDPTASRSLLVLLPWLLLVLCLLDVLTFLFSVVCRIDYNNHHYRNHLATPNASCATTPVGDMKMFDPSRPFVSLGNSILPPIGKVLGYFDAALKVLALHTEARTSFITYEHEPR